MTFTPEQIKLLDADLNAAHVKSRSQSGQTLSYVEGWRAIAEANRIFGHSGWTRETVDLKCVWSGVVNDKPAVTYVAKVRVVAGGVCREGTGAGHGIDRTEGSAHEKAVKEAETDATKRALMTFGWPFGLALYDKDQEHVGDEPKPAAPARPAAAPAPKAAPPPADAVAKFWAGKSYEIACDDLLVFASKIEKAVAAAPTADALLKLETDNATDLAALNNQAPTAWKQVQTVLSAARKKLNPMAA